MLVSCRKLSSFFNLPDGLTSPEVNFFVCLLPFLFIGLDFLKLPHNNQQHEIYQRFLKPTSVCDFNFRANIDNFLNGLQKTGHPSKNKHIAQ